jgi:hypothetical protein
MLTIRHSSRRHRRRREHHNRPPVGRSTGHLDNTSLDLRDEAVVHSHHRSGRADHPDIPT